MVRWKTKGCPRCGGATYIDHDIDGWHEKCMMCSLRIELKNTTNSSQNREEEETSTPQT